MAEKLYYSMGEVAEMFDVNPSLLRHWETQFSQLRPRRNRKGNRLYTPQDVELLKRIYHLVKEQGMTLDGARRALKRRVAAGNADRDAELLERLQRVRALLEEVREELKEEPEEPSVRPASPVSAGVSENAFRTDGSDGATPPVGETRRPGVPRRDRSGALDDDPFACYEQTLF